MKIAIITSRYPSLGKPYNHMFVHMRSKEYIRQGEIADVFVPSNEINEYIFEGVLVREMPSKNIVRCLNEYDVLYLHLLHLYPLIKNDGWPIYKAIIKNKYKFAIYIHGAEAMYFKDRFFGTKFHLRDVLSWIRKDFYHLPRLNFFLCSEAINRGVIITPSIWMKNQINNVFEVNDIRIIPNGIDISLFSFKSFKSFKSATNILSLRPLGDKVYDIESTIEVLSLLPNQFTLDIYGQKIF